MVSLGFCGIRGSSATVRRPYSGESKLKPFRVGDAWALAVSAPRPAHRGLGVPANPENFPSCRIPVQPPPVAAPRLGQWADPHRRSNSWSAPTFDFPLAGHALGRPRHRLIHSCPTRVALPKTAPAILTLPIDSRVPRSLLAHLKDSTTWLRFSYLVGAIMILNQTILAQPSPLTGYVDDVLYRCAMGLACSLMFGWALRRRTRLGCRRGRGTELFLRRVGDSTAPVCRHYCTTTATAVPSTHLNGLETLACFALQREPG